MPSDGKANLRYLGLKNSIFSRLAGAAPQAGVAMRLKAGAARLFTVVHDSATAFRITTPHLRVTLMCTATTGGVAKAEAEKAITPAERGAES